MSKRGHNFALTPALEELADYREHVRNVGLRRKLADDYIGTFARSLGWKVWKYGDGSSGIARISPDDFRVLTVKLKEGGKGRIYRDGEEFCIDVDPERIFSGSFRDYLDEIYRAMGSKPKVML